MIEPYQSHFSDLCNGALSLSNLRRLVNAETDDQLVEHLQKWIALSVENHFTEWKPACIRLMFMASEEKHNDLFRRIQSICLESGILPSRSQDESLANYLTFNLNPCSITPGEHGGSIIEVEINPDYNPLHGNPRVQKYLIAEKKYKAELEKHEAELEKHEKVNSVTKPTTRPPLLSDVWDLPAPSKPIPSILYKTDKNAFEVQKQYSSYSSNLGNAGDPQGDINWIQFLPTSIQELFGFGKDGDRFKFPDVIEINGAIQEFNRVAASKGYGDDYIPFQYVEVEGQITESEYLALAAERKLPIAKPLSGSSWFYHDLLYHVVGMLLTPRDVLLKTINMAEQVSKFPFSEKFSIRLTSFIDATTTYALRIQALEYLRSHSEVDFYCFNNVLKKDATPLQYTDYYNSVILEFAYFAYCSDTTGNEFDSDDFYEILREQIIGNLDKQRMVKLLSYEVKEHLETMSQILAAH